MPSQERAIKGEKNKKTTDEVIPGKEKSKDRREESLPQQSDPDKSGEPSNQDTPKAKKQPSKTGDNTNKGDAKPKKKNEEKKSAH
jgi:hypothetical protein